METGAGSKPADQKYRIKFEASDDRKLILALTADRTRLEYR